MSRSRRGHAIMFAPVLLSLLPVAAAAQQGTQAGAVYRQASAPTAARVRDLLGRMTLDEKVAQLQSTTDQPGENNAANIVRKGVVDAAKARTMLANGIGTMFLFAIDGVPVADGIQNRNALQKWMLDNSRLAIPIMFHGEALHGAAVKGATSFPQAIALGSTWNPALIRQAFDAIGREARAAGDPLVLAPVFDLARDPRYGRVEEMYSEDPYLVGEMGVAAVQGLQGGRGSAGRDHVLATAKHFVHGQPENGTNVGPSDYSERTMRGVFMAPFEKAVKIARIGAVMPSYNELNGGLPAHVNPWLLKTVLRDEWGFTGLTLSDYGALPRLYRRSLVATSSEEAGIRAFNAGLDVELPAQVGFAKLADAVRQGRVAQADIDAAVTRVLTAKFEAGLFEHPYADPAGAALIGSKAHVALARKVAEEAIILLKNEGGLLPLSPAKIRNLAVIGPNADKWRLGTYSGTPPYFATVLEGIRQRVGTGVNVTYAEGARISEPDINHQLNRFGPYNPPSPEKGRALIAEAVEKARAADVVVLALGGNESVSREGFTSETLPKPSLGDVDSLELPGMQNELVAEIAKLGKPVVAVLLNGRPYSLETLGKSVPAIVEGWYLGQETGNALAGVLFGDVNPSGRLPVTIARNAGQLPVFYYRTPQARLGYVTGPNTPVYPFGYGLSYTSFTYGKPSIDRASIAADGTATVSVPVTNAGKRAGAEVVQLYVHPRYSSVVQPIQRLVGFQKVQLKPGETRPVRFAVGPEQLAIWNAEMKRVVEPGKVDLMVGANVQQVQTVTVEVTGAPNRR